jgi:hypothetical protein
MDDSSSGTDWLGSLENLATVGATAYKTITGANVTEAAGNSATAAALAVQANAAAAAKAAAANALPWYKQAWFLPVAIGAALLLVFGVVLKR